MNNQMELQEIFNRISEMLQFNMTTKRYTSGEIYCLVKDLKKDNDKLRFTNNILHQKNKSYLDQIKIIKNSNNDISYIDKIKGNFDCIYKTFKQENGELNQTICGLKQELEYYKQRIKSLKN